MSSNKEKQMWIRDKARLYFRKEFNESEIETSLKKNLGNKNIKCLSCGSEDYFFINGFVKEAVCDPIIINENSEISETEKIIDYNYSVVTVCNKCGYKSYYAAGQLGLLDESIPIHEATRA
ncbi:MAG: hypothetical protein FWB90_00760 [Fibromonadales bacterium]|nr:hypothetical protein [Fibromonadales bacterium]